jgi:predicted flavoprotein YhiN
LIINWTGKETETTTTQLLENYKLENPKKLIFSHRLFDLPTRIWEYFCQNAEIETDRKWQDISKKQLKKSN